MVTAICDTFQQLADTTWDQIETAHRLGMRWSEESNTESLLLELRHLHPSEVSIAAFTRHREAKLGADWKWWFLRRAGAYGMRVQAKRISLPQENFGHLRYKTKGYTKDQMTTLIERAQADQLTPAYCFYVASRRYTRGSTWPTVISPRPSQPSGCLIGHAEVVRSARSNELRRLAPTLMPWHFLVCPGVNGADLSRRADAAMRSIAEGKLAIAPSLEISPSREDGPQDHAEPYLSELKAQPPSHVMRLVQTELPTATDSILNGALRERAIGGVLVIHSVRDVDSA